MRYLLTLAAPLLCASALAGSIARIDSGSTVMEVDDHGSVISFERAGDGPDRRQLLAAQQPAPVLRLRLGGRWFTPDSAAWDAGSGRLKLRYNSANASAEVILLAKRDYITLELAAAEPAQSIELASWGPYPFSVGETVGEIVGVARDRSDAAGIQALNPKTLGGSPARENDIDNEFGIDDPGHYPGLPEELRKGQHFRADTARPTAFGSELQAYVRNRNTERVIDNWGHKQYTVKPFEDGGVTGSRIALFAARESQALQRIGNIEIAEGLPHPKLGGEWAKTAPEASASYLIVDFSESNIDRAVEMTRRAGLRYLYHSSPFSKWGHFELKPSLFPNGWNGFRACVAAARQAGVELGFHTLSNFITPTDGYVTPDPDPRLAIIGGSELSAAVDAAATELPVVDPALFAPKSALNTVRIGNELVRFTSVAAEGGATRLLGCERGAWGTKATAHERAARVSRLLDHDYKVFFADAALSMEIARKIATFCNHTGARQLSFDGLEGNWASGYGQYGRTLFAYAWHEALSVEHRGAIINDASNPGHFNWHINTRMNWGEPWYAGFRESQTLYRFKNQLLFERNYMPHMLGWFALRSDTSIEDAEWLLARAAGFDAGFALATSLASNAQLEADPDSADTARRFGATSAILASIGHWETARLSGAFTAEHKAALRDNRREFHLRPVTKRSWALQEAFVTKHTHPGGGAESKLEYRSPGPEQPVQWVVQSTAKAPVAGFTLRLDGKPFIELGEQAIPAGGHVRYAGGSEVVISDAAWREVARRPVSTPAIAQGATPVIFTLRAAVPADAALKLEVRALGPDSRIEARRP